jgi:hypothetical protein
MAISGISRARERQRRRFPGREREDREELTRTRFSPGFSPCSGPWEYRHGGRGPGRGKPPPRRRVPVRSSSKPPAPGPRRGAVRGIPGKSRLPGCNPPDSVKKMLLSSVESAGN